MTLELLGIFVALAFYGLVAFFWGFGCGRDDERRHWLAGGELEDELQRTAARGQWPT